MSNYDCSVFSDGSKISNSLLVFHLEQVYDLLATWEGKALLFFCLHLALFDEFPKVSEVDIGEFRQILINAKLAKTKRAKKLALVSSFSKTILCINDQNDLYSKLYLAITQQKKFHHKLTITLNQFNSKTGEYLHPLEPPDPIVLQSIIDFINTFGPTGL